MTEIVYKFPSYNTYDDNDAIWIYFVPRLDYYISIDFYNHQIDVSNIQYLDDQLIDMLKSLSNNDVKHFFTSTLSTSFIEKCHKLLLAKIEYENAMTDVIAEVSKLNNDDTIYKNYYEITQTANLFSHYQECDDETDKYLWRYKSGDLIPTIDFKNHYHQITLTSIEEVIKNLKFGYDTIDNLIEPLNHDEFDKYIKDVKQKKNQIDNVKKY